MKSKNKKNVLFVGWVNEGNVPSDGESAKNQCILAELRKYCNIKVIDFYNKKSHPWVYLQAIWAFFYMPKATIIFSTSASNVYRYLRSFMKMGFRRDIIYWGIGGSFAGCVKRRKYGVDCENVFNYLRFNLVESPDMVRELKDADVHNGVFVPNFKQIDYLPNLKDSLRKREESSVTSFVFLSRIRKEKGCSDIFEAVKMLNKKGFKEKFIVDFYGKVDPDYEKTFEDGLTGNENTHYRGILNLKDYKGYDILSSYHAMLFPTYWRAEGFAGIFIDAFIAGLPVIASDWAHNKEVVENGKNGLIFPSHDIPALASLMEKCINREFDLATMSINSRALADKYKADNVITPGFLNTIGLYDE